MHTDKNQNLCAAYIRTIRKIRVQKINHRASLIRPIRQIRVQKPKHHQNIT